MHMAVPDDDNRYISWFPFALFSIVRKFRYLAYRQFTWWGWQHLDRHRCVVLSSCALAKIRQEFPSASEEYIGHQYSPATP